MSPKDQPPNGVLAKPGPHLGHITTATQYRSELLLRRQLTTSQSDPSREDAHRLLGIQLIDNVREHLSLPVRTFATASVYFHKFRLCFRDADYNYQDAALASLFVACKVEDTIKKSREILAAAYCVKNPDKPVASDDKIFEAPGKVVIGLERLILETIGFDFRTRYPQKLLVKVCRAVLKDATPEESKVFYGTAYALCTDMYKTFVPLKRTTFGMVMAVVELTSRLLNKHSSAVSSFAASKSQYYRPSIVETILDLLDLYVQHYKTTKIGTRFDLNIFMDIKIQLNLELEKAFEPRYLFFCNKCETEPFERPALPTPGSATSPTTTSSSIPARSTTRGGASDGTMRFVFDHDAAQSEKDIAQGYFKEEFEEYEIEVEEAIPLPQSTPPMHPRRDDRGRGRGRGRGGFRGDRWGGPYGAPPGPGGFRGDRGRGWRN